MADDVHLSEREQKLAKAYKRKRELPDDPEDARLVAGLISGGVLPLEKSAQPAEDEPEPEQSDQLETTKLDDSDDLAESA